MPHPPCIGSPIRFNRGDNPVGERAAVQRQSKRSAEAPGQSAKADAPVRRNTLVTAMLQAMQSLAVASPPAASPAAPATTAATATTATATARRLTAPERLQEPAVRAGAKPIPSAVGTDPAGAKLTAFLHPRAQSLGLGRSEPASSVPASGSLINVTA